MENAHGGHRDRLRDEFLARPESFPDHKLLELLLFYAIPRRDTNDLAHTLLERFGTLAGVVDATPQALCQVPYITPRVAVLLKSTKEMTRRYTCTHCSTEDVVTSARAAGALLRPYFFGARNEMIYLMCMDGKGRVLATPKVGEGNVNTAEVTTRLIVDAALSNNASMVILAHNHVSGLALPSAEDKATTLYLRQVLRHVGVVLRDHLIFVDDDLVSLRDSGFLLEEQ